MLQPKLLSAFGAVSMALFLGLDMGLTQAQATPGDGSDPFRLSFDELGTGFYQIVQPNGSLGPAVTDNGTVVGGFLRFALPEPVTLGDVAITGTAEGETCTSAANCSDGLRFIQEGNNFFMQYFSDSGEVSPNLADTGFPANFSFGFIGANETGTPDVQETFLYTPGGNSYFGVSDGQLAVPEPASIALLGTSLIGLGLAIRKRRR